MSLLEQYESLWAKMQHDHKVQMSLQPRVLKDEAALNRWLDIADQATEDHKELQRLQAQLVEAD